jgi:GNAT superfamily N-acetyltransferase
VSTREGRLNPADIQVLTDWRNRFVQAFLTEFQAAPERTARWLVGVVGPKENKILFMADDPEGRTWGYMGLDYIDWDRSYGEADAIVRGGEAARGTTKLALRTLLAWSKGQLGLSELGVRVRSDNTAVDFYRKVGFVEVARVPLRRVEEPGMVRWIEDASLTDAQVHLLHMSWKTDLED